jgi:hypothetical protein
MVVTSKRNIPNPFTSLKARYLPDEDSEHDRLREHWLSLQDKTYAQSSTKLQSVADQHFTKYSEMVIKVLAQLREIVYPGHELRVHRPSTLKQHDAYLRNLRWQISSFTYEDDVTYDDGAYDWVNLVTVGISVEDDGKTAGFYCYVDQYQSNDGHHTLHCGFSEKDLIRTLLALHEKPVTPSFR